MVSCKRKIEKQHIHVSKEHVNTLTVYTNTLCKASAQTNEIELTLPVAHGLVEQADVLWVRDRPVRSFGRLDRGAVDAPDADAVGTEGLGGPALSLPDLDVLRTGGEVLEEGPDEAELRGQELLVAGGEHEGRVRRRHHRRWRRRRRSRRVRVRNLSAAGPIFTIIIISDTCAAHFLAVAHMVRVTDYSGAEDIIPSTDKQQPRDGRYYVANMSTVGVSKPGMI